MKETEILCRRAGNKMICIYRDSFSVFIDDINVLTLPVISCVDSGDHEDGEEILSAPVIFKEENSIRITWKSISSLWYSKEYSVVIEDDNFHYLISVRGKNRPTSIRYFTGNIEAFAQGAKYEMGGYALPISARADYYRLTRMMIEDGSIAMGFMTPPCFVYPFWTEGIDTWLGIGLTAEEGGYLFSAFNYKNTHNRCYFEIPYYHGRLSDSGQRLPGIWGGFGMDAIDVVRSYSQFHYEHGLCKQGKAEHPRWWKGPLYCGWGDQVAYEQKEGRSKYDYANQYFYTQMSERLDDLGLKPTAIIIDDKWQKEYGSLVPDEIKWPDLRGFVEHEHAKGRKVLLWVKTWNVEGLSADECISIENQPCAADPTNPAYQAHLSKCIHRLLSDEDGCYNCDGFKLDFVNNVILHPAIHTYDQDVWGIELVKRMISLFYHAAKQVKPDALINNSCAHPYFAEVCDQARLHDYRDSLRCIMSIMKYRKDLYAAALPYALIDTDSSNRENYREAKLYQLHSAELGVPDLYMVSDTEDVTLTLEDWKEIKNYWEAYAEKIEKE